jgi:hypothetical protein
MVAIALNSVWKDSAVGDALCLVRWQIYSLLFSLIDKVRCLWAILKERYLVISEWLENVLNFYLITRIHEEILLFPLILKAAIELRIKVRGELFNLLAPQEVSYSSSTLVGIEHAQ